jgi:hypothetical protein
MVRRLFALALAFAVTGAPVAADLCDARCARHAGHVLDRMQPAAAHHHHPAGTDAQKSHHHDFFPDAARSTCAATTLPHPCGHADVVITQFRHVERAPMLKGVLTAAAVSPILVPLWTYAAFDSRYRPPGPTRSVSPLRL